MKVKIQDIAKLAGVSIATVSRVLNNSKPVKEEIRNRVLEAVKQTNYRAGALAGVPIANESSLIGVIIPEFSNTVIDDFIVGINNVSKLYGYDTIIAQTDGTAEHELHYLELFGKLQTRGIIFVGSPLGEKHVQILQTSNTPCILVGQVSSISSIPSVHVDNITASYEAVTYLIQKGHRKIAMICGSGEGAVGGDRFQGYRQALADAGIPIHEDWIAESKHSIEDGTRAMRKIIETGSMPTAVFCATDWMAVGAMNVLADSGIRIPEDIAVFGFDGSYMSSLVRPKLSTVEYSATEIGMTATRNLLKLIRGEKDIPRHTNITHFLAIRDSTN